MIWIQLCPNDHDGWPIIGVGSGAFINVYGADLHFELYDGDEWCIYIQTCIDEDVARQVLASITKRMREGDSFIDIGQAAKPKSEGGAQ